MSKKVIIIRHGESMGNLGGRTENASSIPLSELGMEQAKGLVKELEKPEAIIHSSYIRTKQTATPLLELFPDIIPEEWDSTREFNYLSGEKYNNTTFEERMIPRESFWSRNDPHYTDGDDAESFAQFIERGEQVLEDIAMHKAGHIVLFSHEQFILLLHFIHEHRALLDKAKTDPEAMKEAMRLFKETVFDAKRVANATPIDISHMVSL